MTVPTFPFDADRIDRTRRVFPDEIELDDWVMFHATSNLSEEAIERDGFEPSLQRVSLDDLTRLVALFDTMRWVGTDTGGYGVLKVYSIGHDLADPDQHILYFAETSGRAVLSATREFAGGEKCYALRRAFEHLDSYLRDPAVRAEHLEYQTLEYEHLVQLGAHESAIDAAKPVEVDLDWLRASLDDFSELRAAAEEVLNRYRYGIVYAVHAGEREIPLLSAHHSMGIETRSRISPSAIVGKVVIPAEFEEPWPPGNEVHELLRRMERGLLPALRAS